MIDVASFNNRVHIQCWNPMDPAAPADFRKLGSPTGVTGAYPPHFVAVEATSPMAQTVVQIGVAAVTSQRKAYVFWDDSPSANPAGCNVDDCRRLIGVSLK